MAAVLSTFKRYEKKYMLDPDQYRLMLDYVNQYMSFDKYCVGEKYYSLINIYYDTPDNLLIGRSVEKPVYKEKLRLRSYFPPENEDSKVFFEIKKKFEKCVTKRRVVLRYGEALEFTATGKAPRLKDDSYINTQVAKEIEAMFQRYPGLSPAVFIAYDRIAMFGKEDKELRLTFDTNIRARRENPTFEYGTGGTPLLPPDKYLMEIKIPAAMPLWLAHFMSENGIFNSRFSKYGKEYENYVKNTKENQILLSEA